MREGGRGENQERVGKSKDERVTKREREERSGRIRERIQRLSKKKLRENESPLPVGLLTNSLRKL